MEIRLNQQWSSIYWKSLSCFAFAGINGGVRYLSGASSLSSLSLYVFEIIFIQHFIAALFLFPILIKDYRKGGFFGLAKMPKIFCLRIFGAIAGLGAWYLALSYMPIAQVVALGFLTPILTALGAFIILKENLSILRFIAIVLGFVGGFYLMDQNIGEKISEFNLKWWIILPLIASILFSMVKLLTRHLGANGERPTILAGQLILFMVPPSFILSFNYWTTPTLYQLFIFIILGALTALAHYSFCKAYVLGEVTALLPVGGIKFVFSAAIGFYIFNENPDGNMWIGVSTLFLAIIFLFLEEKNLKSISN